MSDHFKKILVCFLTCLFMLEAVGCASSSIKANGQNRSYVYALVTKSANNKFNELEAEGFKEAVERNHGTALICEPEEATAEAQISIIRDLIDQKVDAIAIAANDENALSSVIRDARNKGILVSTLDSDCSGSMLFANQASAVDIADALVDAVYDLCDGEGQWAILSATSRAQNQNGWINAMQVKLEDKKYANLRLVSIAYGDDNSEVSKQKTRELLNNYPDLKCICAPATVGLYAAAQTIVEQDSKVVLTGLGLPSEMAQYVSGSRPVCPKFYLWNPITLGKLSGHISLALVGGVITGAEGEAFEIDELGIFRITSREGLSNEVILDKPIEFNVSNIDTWKNQF